MPGPPNAARLWKRRLRAASLLLAGTSALACAGATHIVEEVEYERTIEQVTVVPAARAPVAAGPLAPARTATFEAVGTASVFTAPTRPRIEGGPGQWTAGDWLGGRTAVGATDWLELGVALEASPTVLASRASTRIPKLDDTALGRATFGVRMASRLGEGASVIGSLELDAWHAPYLRSERLRTVTTHYEQDGDPAVTEDEDEWSSDSATWGWAVRGGLAAQAEVGRFTLGAGFSLQTVPSYFGRDTATWTCTRWSDGDEDCTEDPEPPSWEATLAPTLFAVGAYRVSDRVLVVAQPYANVYGDRDAVRSAPAGVVLGLRYEAPLPE